MATVTLKKCDRCGAVAARADVRAIEIIEHLGPNCGGDGWKLKVHADDTHSTPDLCEHCRKQLDRFLGGEDLAKEYK